jgi:hypothetical protein
LSYFMSETFIIEEYRKLYQFLVKYENWFTFISKFDIMII